MQPLTKTQQRAFVTEYLATMDPTRAALAAGAKDGLRILEQEDVLRQLEAARRLLAAQVTPEDIVHRMAALAFGRANDCVRLALDSSADIDALELSLLSEIRRNEKGTVEIKLIDRIRVLERLLTLDRGGESEAAAFFRAMQAAGEQQQQEELD